MSIGVRIEWLGHSTFLLSGEDGTTVLVEAFVDSNPSCPESRRQFDRLDVVALTHGHGDHVGDVFAVCERHSPCAVVAQVELAGWLRSSGLSDDIVVEMNKGGTVDLDGVRVTMVDANHSAGIQGPDGPIYGGEATGLVFEFASGARVYHAGDTNVFGDMALIAELYEPDVALLPIGGHYTMGPREAAKACELLGVARVIPMHWGTWPVLAGTPEQLREECASRGLAVDVIDLEPGQVWE